MNSRYSTNLQVDADSPSLIRVNIMRNKKQVLFLCTGNSCRSQMADGIINADFGEKISAFSAGTHPQGLNPKAVAVMAEIGIDISGNSSDHISRFDQHEFDYVITLCGDADEKCPVTFGGVCRRHIGFDDPPKAIGSEDEVLNVYRRVRDEIRQDLGRFFLEELEILDR
jgi:arsenate reductase